MLDCIAILSLTCEDARTVFELTAKHDREDDLSRESQQVNTDRLSERKFTFGVPKSDQLKVNTREQQRERERERESEKGEKRGERGERAEIERGIEGERKNLSIPFLL